MTYIGGPSPYEMSEGMTNSLYPTFEVIEGEPNLDKFDSFTIPGLEDRLKEGRSTYFLHPRFADELGVGERLIQATYFSVREDWAVGREDSSQAVFFGENEINIDGAENHTVPFAVKPYKIFERDRAIHEYVALDHFQDNPGLRSFEPLGFWVDEQGYPSLLTRFEQNVISLDNIDWSKDGQHPLKDHFSLFEALQKSAQILARLHIQGFTHRDAQIKNMAVDTSQDEVRLIDLTTLQKIHDTDEPDEIKWERAVADDLRTLVSSVRNRGYLRGEVQKDVRNMVNMALLAIHASMLRHPSSQTTLFNGAPAVVNLIDKTILDEV
jgi:hypothetical protein